MVKQAPPRAKEREYDMVAPQRSSTLREMASPRPVPPVLVVKLGVKSLS